MNRFWTHHTLIACFDFPNGLQIHWTDRTPVYSISFWVCDVARRSRSLRVRCATLCQKNWSNTNGTRNKSDKHFETMPSKSLFYHQLQWCCYPHSCKIMTWTVKLTNCERETTQWNLHQHVFFANPTSIPLRHFILICHDPPCLCFAHVSQWFGFDGGLFGDGWVELRRAQPDALRQILTAMAQPADSDFKDAPFAASVYTAC